MEDLLDFAADYQALVLLKKSRQLSVLDNKEELQGTYNQALTHVEETLGAVFVKKVRKMLDKKRVDFVQIRACSHSCPVLLAKNSELFLEVLATQKQLYVEDAMHFLFSDEMKLFLMNNVNEKNANLLLMIVKNNPRAFTIEHTRGNLVLLKDKYPEVWEEYKSKK